MTSGIPPLAGYCVAVTADRRAEEQIALLERRGANVILGPTVRTVPLVDDGRLAAAIDQVIAEPPDVVVLLTGIGTRGMFAAAESRGCDDDLLGALQGALVIARGPKAAGAGTTIGLDIGWHAPTARSGEIVEHLHDDARAGARIAIQRDGHGQAVLADSLAQLGAEVIDIPVYRWELPADLRPALRLIEAIVDGEVDAVTFTSSPAVCHLVALAAEAGHGPALIDALRRRVVSMCVGPVCAETARDLGMVDAVIPQNARLGAMVQALSMHFRARSASVETRAGRLTMQGRAVFVDGVVAPLGARERSVLDVLADARGAVVAKPRLLRSVWGPDFDDEHAVEVAIGRLRRGLGSAGNAVETVPRRGYRLAG